MSAMNTEYTSLLREDSKNVTKGEGYDVYLSPPVLPSSLSVELSLDVNDRWGATPRIRTQWLKPSTSFSNITRALSIRDIEQSTLQSPTYQKTPIFENEYNQIDDGISSHKEDKVFGFQYEQWGLWNTIEGTPGLLIAVILNLFLSTSFGLAMFPPEWTFPTEVPRAIGVQMFLFSTLICQLVLTKMSQFPGPVGMMMVENIPFLQVISRTAIKVQGQGIETFSTVFFTFALASVVVGVFFYCLGKFNLGNAVYFFPKHIIVGCIGGKNNLGPV